MRKVAAALVLAAVALAASGTARATSEDYRWAKRIAAAERFAEARAGTVSFAVVDESGRLRGAGADRVHYSASVVKVMLLIAYLREPGVRDDELMASERQLLGPMIKRSDNDAANTVYTRVGADAIYDLARDARMEQFTTQPTWGLSTITAGEQARFFFRLERFIPRRHRPYAMHLLTRIIRRQRWGIPPVAPAGWKLHFKGGWAGAPSWRVNQVMLLRRPRRRFAVAILTSSQPSKDYGDVTIRRVAERLLRGYNRITD